MDNHHGHGRGGAPNGAAQAGGHLTGELLDAYCDPAAGGLAPAARASAELHLAHCTACREAVAERWGMLTLLRALPQVAPRRSFVLTPELIEGAGGKVGRDDRRRVGAGRLAWVWPVRWASALVTLLLVITIGLDLSLDRATPAGQAARAAPPTAPLTASPISTAPRVSENIFPDPATDPPQGVVIVFGLTPTVYPTPGPDPESAPAGVTGRMDWYPAETALGALASVLACWGFVLPPFLRRRAAAP